MRFGVKAFIEETRWTGAVRTLHEMIGFGTGAVNFSTSGAVFVATSFVSSGSQKKENSDSSFGRGDDGDALIFIGEATLFMSSVSGFQKKDSSVMGFISGDTGEVMNFVGEAIRSDLTC